MLRKRVLLFILVAVISREIFLVAKGFQVNEESRKDELLCRRCGHGVAKPEDLISVPSVKALRQRNDTILFKDKVLIQLFENPQGSKFEVLTAKKASVTAHDERSAIYSWFPGFFWSIIVCPQCGNHLGWMFDPVDDVDKEINVSFFGLIFSHLIGSSYADSVVMTPKSYQS